MRAGYRSDLGMVTICIIGLQKKKGPGFWPLAVAQRTARTLAMERR